MFKKELKDEMIPTGLREGVDGEASISEIAGKDNVRQKIAGDFSTYVSIHLKKEEVLGWEE